MAPYNAIVVGGRIAGSATASFLSQAGARVLLLERATFPSAPVSVPVLFSNSLALLDKLGIRERVEAAGGTRMYHGGAWLDDLHLFAPVLPYHGINYNLGLRREVLDEILIDHARQQPGVTLRTGFTVTGLVWQDSRVIGVRGRQGGGAEETLYADVVVGADGMRSIVARNTKPREYRRRKGQNAPYYAYYRGFVQHMPAQSISYRGSGFGVLVFPADNGLTAISVGVHKQLWPRVKADVETEFERLWRSIPDLAERGRGAERVGPVKGQEPRPAYYRLPFGPGWALVGDAGYMKDPVTGQGIHDALRSAELFADSWQQWRAGSAWNDAMRSYQQTRDRETKALYNLTYQSSKVPKRQQLSWFEHVLLRPLADDSDYAARFTGVYNGATDADQVIGPFAAIELMVRSLFRPLALRWAVRRPF
ncbi:MAG: NAD(P)/FAD-dependent oxidoreductase [Herpetosiphonaceae bacterium]|nr:NAD(P)/FAD-dependent oxidoreductase [Herpetosiphonaceae bacterium]